MNKIYHIGIVVADLEAAIDYYHNKFGLRFAEVSETKLRITNPQTQVTEEANLRVTYSRSGSPYIELIEAVGGGIFSATNSGEILYYGVWESNIDKRIQQLQEQSIAIDALIADGDDPSAIITEKDEFGVRVEYVSDKLQGYVKAWTLTGRNPLNSRLSLLLSGFFTTYYFVKNALTA